MSELSKRLRNACAKLRTTPVSLSDFIPLLQDAADALDAGPPICADTGKPKYPGDCWNVRCQLGWTCCRATPVPADPCPQCERGGTCNTPECGRKRSSELMRAYGVPVSPAPLTYDRLEQVIDAYVDDYEMVGEAEDGRDACYQPTEQERIVIKDAIMGLLADPDWDAEWGKLIEQRAIELATQSGVQACATCNGTGWAMLTGPGGGEATCPDCHGAGRTDDVDVPRKPLPLAGLSPWLRATARAMPEGEDRDAIMQWSQDVDTVRGIPDSPPKA
jgi:hypothetical protein